MRLQKEALYGFTSCIFLIAVAILLQILQLNNPGIVIENFIAKDICGTVYVFSCSQYS